MTKKIYTVWYSCNEGSGTLYSNNIPNLEKAREDVKEILRHKQVHKAWIKVLEEALVEEAFPALDLMTPVDSMDASQIKEVLIRFQELAAKTILKLPSVAHLAPTIDNIPENIEYHLGTITQEKQRRKDLEEEIIRLTEEKQKRKAFEEEVTRLRKVVSKIAENLGNGSCLSEKASIEFIEQLPGEVKLVVDGLNSAINTAKKNYSDWVADRCKKKYNALK